MFPTERSQAINIANEAAELSLLVSPDNLFSALYWSSVILRMGTHFFKYKLIINYKR